MTNLHLDPNSNVAGVSLHYWPDMVMPRSRMMAAILITTILHALVLLLWGSAYKQPKQPMANPPVLENQVMQLVLLSPQPSISTDSVEKPLFVAPAPAPELAPQPLAPVLKNSVSQVAARKQLVAKPVLNQAPASSSVDSKHRIPVVQALGNPSDFQESAEITKPEDSNKARPSSASATYTDSKRIEQALRGMNHASSYAEQANVRLQGAAMNRTDQQFSQAVAHSAKGDCVKGQFKGGGLGLLSAPFLAAAVINGDCAR